MTAKQLKQHFPETSPQLQKQLAYLGLSFAKDHYAALAAKAAKNNLSHLDFLAELVEAETLAKQDRSILRRIRLARFPVIKTLDQFQWSWPTTINELQVKNLFRLDFLHTRTNVIFLGGVGLGKTHLCTALGHAACLSGHSVLFSSAIDTVNSLNAAQAAGRLKQELARYTKPNLLILDELGYLPIDKTGADLLFQIFSQRYELGSTVISSNRAYKHWPAVFHNDATLTSALLDRLLHHSDTVHIEGKSFRMKENIHD